MPEITEADNDEAVTGVRLVKAATFELNPDKFYLMIFDRRSIKNEDIQTVGKLLKDRGIQGLSLAIMGDPGTVKIVEAEAKAKK